MAREAELARQRQEELVAAVTAAEEAVKAAWAADAERMAAEHAEEVAEIRAAADKAVAEAQKACESRVSMVESKTAHASKLSGFAQENRMNALRASLEQQQQQQQAREKEERVELLRRQVRERCHTRVPSDARTPLTRKA